MLRLVLSCAIIVVVYGQTTSISQCTNTTWPLPLNAYVHGCINPPCVLPQLQNVVVDVIFRAPRVIRSMTTLAVATLNIGLEINIPYDLGENSKTCNFFTNTFCPLLEGEVVQYRLMMFIERFFPAGTQTTVEFRIVDNERNNEVVWCIRLPIRIVAAESKTKTANQERNSTSSVL